MFPHISFTAFLLLIAGSAQAAPQEKLRDLLVRGAIAGSHGFVVESAGRYPRDSWHLAIMDLLKKESVSPDVLRCVEAKLGEEVGSNLHSGILAIVSAFDNLGHKYENLAENLKANKDSGLPLDEIRKEFAWSMDAFRRSAVGLMVKYQAGYLDAESAARSIDSACSGTAVPAPRAPKKP